MSLLVHLTLLPLAALGFALALFLALEIAAAIMAPKKTYPSEDARAGRATVVVPAHNEAAQLPATLLNIQGQLRGNDRVLVVADNCTDETAEIARAAGADVIERNDPARRGKGYALQFALDHLRVSPPPIVVFTDADCQFAPGALQKVVAAAAMEGRPAQALYLMKAPKEGAPRLQIAEFAWAFMNKVRMGGLHRLFGVTRFTGAGLAAPWGALADLQLGAGEIVEDLALTMELIGRDAPPLLVADAVVTSEFPVEDAALTRQAARWSIGSMSYGARASIGALFEGFQQGRNTQIGAAIDLMVPPITIFGAALGLLAVASLCGWLVSGVSSAFYFSIWALALAVGSIVAAWLRFGREILPVSALGGVVQFLLSKVAVFGAKGRESAKRWTPTRGGSDEAGQ